MYVQKFLTHLGNILNKSGMLDKQITFHLLRIPQEFACHLHPCRVSLEYKYESAHIKCHPLPWEKMTIITKEIDGC